MRYNKHTTPHPVTRHSLLRISVIGALLISLIANHALAQTGTTTNEQSDTPPIELLETIEANQDEQRSQVATDRSQLHQTQTGSETLSERRRTRITNLAANMSNRTEAAIDRLDTIADRLDRRIDKERAAGHDTTTSQQAVDTARIALSTARELIEDIDEDIHHFTHAQNPGQAWQHVWTIYSATHQSIHEAHTALRIALNELKNTQANNAPEATGTDQS